MTEPRSALPTTILRDTREQHPWTFDGCNVTVSDATLATGDYAFQEVCTCDPDTNTYHPEFAIERKSGHDLLNTLTWERERFKAEMRRASGWTRPLPVVVEAPWEAILRKRGTLARRSVDPNQIAGTVAAWTRHYNVVFRFAETRQQAKRCAFLLLVRYCLHRRLDRK